MRKRRRRKRRIDSREKKWVKRKKCKMGDRVKTVYRKEK